MFGLFTLDLGQKARSNLFGHCKIKFYSRLFYKHNFNELILRLYKHKYIYTHINICKNTCKQIYL